MLHLVIFPVTPTLSYSKVAINGGCVTYVCPSAQGFESFDAMIANKSRDFHDFFMFAALSFFALLVFLVVNVFQKVRQTPKLRSVAILVLGDVGRSPRMMYHAESFAKLGFDTYLIGYKGESYSHRIVVRLTFDTSGSKPILSLTSLSNIRLCYLSEPPPLVMRIPFVLAAPIKILYQIATILYALVFDIPRPPEFIMVQVWISMWL